MDRLSTKPKARCDITEFGQTGHICGSPIPSGVIEFWGARAERHAGTGDEENLRKSVDWTQLPRTKPDSRGDRFEADATPKSRYPSRREWR